MKRKTFITLYTIGVFMVSYPVLAQEDTVLALQKSLDSSIRNDEDKKRDKIRKPVETLTFLGIKKDMSVLELIPGTGWYTKILGAFLAEQGEYALAIGTNRVEQKLVTWNIGTTKILETNSILSTENGKGQYQLDKIDLPKNQFDMVLTFRNLHNFDNQTQKLLHKAVFEALKVDGVYGVVDHTKRHMEPWNIETWRRVDPISIIKEIQSVGFQFVDFSPIHYRADDELRYDTTRPSINRNSDRFTLKFVKPST